MTVRDWHTPSPRSSPPYLQNDIYLIFRLRLSSIMRENMRNNIVKMDYCWRRVNLCGYIFKNQAQTSRNQMNVLKDRLTLVPQLEKSSRSIWTITKILRAAQKEFRREGSVRTVASLATPRCSLLRYQSRTPAPLRGVRKTERQCVSVSVSVCVCVCVTQR